MITYRPSDAEIGMNEYDLQWLVDNQVLTLEGDLNFFDVSAIMATSAPLEFWAKLKITADGDTGELVTDSGSESEQDASIIRINQWLRTNSIVWGSPKSTNNIYWENVKSSDTLPFKLTVNPRLQVGIIITLDPRRGYSGLLEAEYAGGTTTRYDNDTKFSDFQGSSDFSKFFLNLGLVEGDSIEWDGSYFTVQHYGQIIFKDNYCTPVNNIIPTYATSLEQTEEQAQDQGRLDDPLTDEDEGIDFTPEDDTTFRPVDFNKRRLEVIRRARYRNGSQTIGSAFLAGLAYMALTFIRRG